MPADELAKVDIARMNLLCAEGLPGAEDIDLTACLATLDRWAQTVKLTTEQHLYRLTDPQFADHAEHFQHSEARFRAAWLVNVLQTDMGVHYHKGFVPADQDSKPFKTSKETFIHGLMDKGDPRQSFGGNCVSLPVLYVAIGRRLGYPVKLVASNEHLFCRWVGKDHANPLWQDEFNFDGAGKGFSIDPDSFYMSWPRKSSASAVEVYDWFKPLTPEQELSTFLMSRGHVLRHVRDDQANAQVAYAHALRLWPTSRAPLMFLTQTVQKHWDAEVAAHPGIYRQLQGANAQRPTADPEREPPSQGQRPSDAFAEIRRINEINRRNMQRFSQMHTVPGQPQASQGAWHQPQPYLQHPNPTLPGQPPQPQ